MVEVKTEDSMVLPGIELSNLVMQTVYKLIYQLLLQTEMFSQPWSSSRPVCGCLPFNAGIKPLRATLPAEIFYWGFQFLKSSLREVFISRSALKG
jgi:hypothetical protein